jgi:hypothetical protein
MAAWLRNVRSAISDQNAASDEIPEFQGLPSAQLQGAPTDARAGLGERSGHYSSEPRGPQSSTAVSSLSPPLVLPDPCHVRRSQARDIAEGLVQLLAIGDITQVWLYIAPNGDVAYETGRPMNGIGDLSLVGVYTAQASQQNIVEDILAMEREPIA